jgi:DnaK suppressor protein
MTKKKITKEPLKKFRKKVAGKTIKKTKTKGREKKTLKKVKTPEKVRKVKAPKRSAKIKITKKVRSAKKVKVLKKIKPPEKLKPVKSLTKVPLSKKLEEERKYKLRAALIKKREEIVKEAKSEISRYIKGETKQLVDTALDDGDWSVVDLSEDLSLKKLSSHRETLLKIDEALRKLEEGTYGKCDDCGEDISEERLKVLPFAIYCRDCQEKREFIEEIERKERME